jgi:hypothetical protein
MTDSLHTAVSIAHTDMLISGLARCDAVMIAVRFVTELLTHSPASLRTSAVSSDRCTILVAGK